MRTSTGVAFSRRSWGLASRRMLKMMGAQHMWVTPCAAMFRYISAAVGFRRHTLVPPRAAMPHVKVHPLQWNIGSDQRYTGALRISHPRIRLRVLRYAPRWLYTTPLGSDVVPEV